jgi:hypothetical protein
MVDAEGLELLGHLEARCLGNFDSVEGYYLRMKGKVHVRAEI